MTINNNKRIVLALVVAACLNFTSCVKDGGLTPRVLEGEWELVSVDGDDNLDGVEWIWEFEDDGDFKWCLDFGYGNDCFRGDWEWNDDKDELEMDYTDSYGDSYSVEFEVEVLDKETLSGDYSNGGGSYELEFEKVD